LESLNERYVSTLPILFRFNNSELRLQIPSAKGNHKSSGDHECYGPNFTKKFVSPTKVAECLDALVCNLGRGLVDCAFFATDQMLSHSSHICQVLHIADDLVMCFLVLFKFSSSMILSAYCVLMEVHACVIHIVNSTSKRTLDVGEHVIISIHYHLSHVLYLRDQ